MSDHPGRWDTDQVELNADTISAYAIASELTSPMEPMPSLEASWRGAVESLKQQVEDDSEDFLFDNSALDEFVAVLTQVRQTEPRLLRRVNFPDCLRPDFEALLARVDRELQCDRSYTPEKDGYDSEADASFGLAASLRRLYRAVPTIKRASKTKIASLIANGNRCREAYNELGDDEDNYSAMREEHRARSNEPFDVSSVFADL